MWKITTNIVDGKKFYGVYQTLDPNEIDHSGNREVLRYYDTKEDAEMVAEELNKGVK